jgi:acyl-CoA synthetase (AMP-forming)/AMP-acid ligase II
VGIKAGDTVCLFMPGRSDYIAAWLGITKVGGVAALINTKLVGTSMSIVLFKRFGSRVSSVLQIRSSLDHQDWKVLADKRLAHLCKLSETGRWRWYHTEAAFLESLREARSGG